MVMDTLSDKDWRRVIEAIKKGTCVLVIGPDVEFEHNGHGSSSIPQLLATKLAEPLLPNPSIVTNDLAHVAQMRYADDRIGLELDVDEFFKNLSIGNSRFHRDLAALPFSLCLSASPDNLMTNAFVAAKKSPSSDYYHFRRHRKFEPPGPGPFVYHLFGALEDLDSLVLTETDFLEFLVNVVRGTPQLPGYIEGQLADKKTSFLFLGFGFQRWYVRVLLHVLQTYDHRNRSLAIEASSFFQHPDVLCSSLFFEQKQKIEFHQQSWGDFAAELRRRYEAQEGKPQARPVPAHAPKVFLCHDTRDREKVVTIQEELQSRGINTWRDQQDLRGGDNWDRQIVQVVKKQVDYVLVLQTPNMLERAETYIHTEIAEALERQKRFDQGERFLIPAILEPCDGLERLSHLHREDLTKGDGVGRLAETIQRDWVGRQTRGREAPP